MTEPLLTVTGIRQEAERFIEFCDGLEEAGMRVYAQRGRCIARETIRLADEVTTYRPLLRELLAWRNSLLICGKCEKHLVYTKPVESAAA